MDAKIFGETSPGALTRFGSFGKGEVEELGDERSEEGRVGSGERASGVWTVVC